MNTINQQKYSSSEYGKGFAYCLGLFLAHAERTLYGDKLDGDESLWFSSAGDHVFELCTDSEVLGNDLAEQTKSFRKFVLSRRYNYGGTNVPKEDVYEAIRQAKHLLFLWDAAKGVDCVKGEYE
jgi:hypothetical protein